MLSRQIIYGQEIVSPITPPFHEIEGFGLLNKNQYWKRKDLPSFFEEVEYDRDGNALLTNEQISYAEQEVSRCKNGYWFYNNGVPLYITGKNYFYIQWWKLEDDIHADFRMTDRDYFVFMDFWEKTPWCLGIVRGKKRREGASSQATANLIYECVFFRNSVCGLVSKSEKDGKKTFLNMVAFGYRQLPVFLKPKQLNGKDSVSELIFAHKSVETKGGRGKTIDNDTGHRSSVDYRAPGKNTYDSGRLSRGLFDEGGKWEKENPFSTFISVVSKTLVKGVRRVGFIECPSTINELTKSGGEEYKKVWDNANQFKGTRSVNRLVRYFTPAYDGYLGFIDQHGVSVIDTPDKDQYDYLVANFAGVGDLTEEDIKQGAKKYLLSKREGLTGTLLEEEIRMNPFTEEEMFMYAGFGCEFNAVNINKQVQELEDSPVFLRRCRLVLSVVKHEAKIGFYDAFTRLEVSFMDDEKGGWLLHERPNKANAYIDKGRQIEPLNKFMYQIGVDTTKDDFAVNGSKPTICVMKKSCIVDGAETGLYPVAFYDDKTRLDVHFDEEVFKACLWYGCSVNYEIDARTDFYRFFAGKNATRLLEWTPKIAQDPIKKGLKIKPGTQSGDPFQLAAQLQVCKMYIDGTDPDYYNGHVHRIVYPDLLKQLLKYDHSDRTKSDQVIALMMALLPIVGESQAPIKPQRSIQIVPTYKIKMR